MTISNSDNTYTHIGLHSIDSSSTNSSKTQGQKSLGQSDFLRLLTTQLANQDPLAPTDSKEFITQMSQFASLDSLQSLENKFDGLSQSMSSNQALQASSLVGRQVLIPASIGFLAAEKSLSGEVNLPSDTKNIRFEIKNSKGEIIKRFEGGDHSMKDLPFIWDGENEAGKRVKQGQYEILAFGLVNGKSEQLATSLHAQVQSVNLGNSLKRGGFGNIQLNLIGLGEINFKEIKAVG
jgi:flagellar basal-body rod modification protein FlgD